MSLMLEENIRTFAKDLIFQKVMWEYQQQIGKWELALIDVGLAFRDAFDNHEGKLKEVEAKRRQRLEFALMAFSLVGGLALSWAGAYIQYKLAPKMIGKMETRLKKLELLYPSPYGYSTPTMIYSNLEYNKVAAKMFGTITTDIAGTGFDLILSNMKESDKSSGSIAALNSMTDIRKSEDFGTNLKRALKEQSLKTVDEIGDFGETVENNSDFGEKYLNYGSVKAQKNDESKLQRAKKLVIQDLNKVRETWKKNWFYYGNDPNFPPKAQMEKAIEREIWAFWILEQDFIVYKHYPSFMGDSTYRPSNKVPDSLVLDRFAELDIISARSDIQAIRQHKRLNPIGGKTQEVYVLGISGEIDTQKEVNAINKWAKEHKPDLITGNLRSISRELRSVENLFGKDT